MQEPTFTEDEIKDAIKYINFVSTHGVFQVKEPQMQEAIKLKSSLIKLVKKCEGYIFEIKEHIKAEAS